MLLQLLPLQLVLNFLPVLLRLLLLRLLVLSIVRLLLLLLLLRTTPTPTHTPTPNPTPTPTPTHHRGVPCEGSKPDLSALNNSPAETTSAPKLL